MKMSRAIRKRNNVTITLNFQVAPALEGLAGIKVDVITAATVH